MKKNLKIILFFLLALLAAILINYTEYNNPVLIPIVGILGVYLLLSYRWLAYYIMILTVFIPNYAVIGPFRIAGSDATVLLIFVFWLLASVVNKKKIKIPSFYVFTLIFLMALIASLSGALNMENSIKEIGQYLFFTTVYLFVIYNNLTSKHLIKNLLRAAVYGAFILAVFAVLYFLMGNVNGLYNLGFHKNALGGLMALSFPLAFMNARANPSLHHFFIMATIGGALVVSLSRGAWFGAAAGVLIVELLYYRRDLLRNVGLAALSLVFATLMMPSVFVQSAASSHTLNIRKEQWEISKKGFLQNPLTGIGYANFLELSRENVEYEYFQHEDPHNIVFRIAAETGLIGLICFFVLFATLYSYCFKTIKQESEKEMRWYKIGIFAALIAYLGHGLFDVFWVRGTGSYFWILVSLMVLLKEQDGFLLTEDNVKNEIS